MKYGYSYEKEEQLLNKKKKLQASIIIEIIIGIVLWLLFYKLSEDNWELEEHVWIYYILIIVVEAILCCSSILNNVKSQIAIDNLKMCYLEFHNTYVCGYYFADISKNNDGCFFELKYTDIRKVDYTEFGDYTLLIHHTNGTYRLPVEKSHEIANKLNKIIEKVKKDKNYSYATFNQDEEIKRRKIEYSISNNSDNSEFCDVCGAMLSENEKICHVCQNIIK